MRSIKTLYKIGRGPSSSHTIGVERAAEAFRRENPDAVRFRAVLYNSLALTGRGHGTDAVLRRVLRSVEVVFSDTPDETLHPNTLDLTAFFADGGSRAARYESVGGGEIRRVGAVAETEPDVYECSHFSDIKRYCTDNGVDLFGFIVGREDASFLPYLADVWKRMRQAIGRGLRTPGVLPGALRVRRKAPDIYRAALAETALEAREIKLLYAYAYAVSEENAAGGVVVTAPTCGASGVLPAVLYYMKEKYRFPERDIVRALAVAGLAGNLIRTNASVSGAECGCQAEIGSACVMAAAAVCELFHADLDRTECAMEIAMEHHLGLTCDPVAGQVQIPCIERNAVAATRAVNAFYVSDMLRSTRKISFDQIVRTMYETGRDLASPYRETSRGGLAKLYAQLSDSSA